MTSGRGGFRTTRSRLSFSRPGLNLASSIIDQVYYHIVDVVVNKRGKMPYLVRKRESKHAVGGGHAAGGGRCG